MCFVYLVDVALARYSGFTDTDDGFSNSRWFTRGWTLQELIARSRVEFYSKDWCLIQVKAKPDGDISRIRFLQKLCDISGIRYNVLTDPLAVTSIPYNERLSWISRRFTTEEEDLAYCLMSLFNVKMPVKYGEGRAMAFVRLNKDSKLALELNDSPELVYSFD